VGRGWGPFFYLRLFPPSLGPFIPPGGGGGRVVVNWRDRGVQFFFTSLLSLGGGRAVLFGGVFSWPGGVWIFLDFEWGGLPSLFSDRQGGGGADWRGGGEGGGGRRGLGGGSGGGASFLSPYLTGPRGGMGGGEGGSSLFSFLFMLEGGGGGGGGGRAFCFYFLFGGGGGFVFFFLFWGGLSFLGWGGGGGGLEGDTAVPGSVISGYASRPPRAKAPAGVVRPGPERPLTI